MPLLSFIAAFVAAASTGRDLAIHALDIPAPRFGLFRSDIDEAMSPHMQQALDSAIAAIQSVGSIIVDVLAPRQLERAHAAHRIIQDYEAGLALGHEHHHHPELLSAPLRQLLDDSRNIEPAEYDDARRTANHARKLTRDLFADCDVLLTPSAPGAAPKGLASTGDPAFNRVWTLLGTPTVNVAGLSDPQGMPLGMQIIAPFGHDLVALQAAHWLESQLAKR